MEALADRSENFLLDDVLAAPPPLGALELGICQEKRGGV